MRRDGVTASKEWEAFAGPSTPTERLRAAYLAARPDAARLHRITAPIEPPPEGCVAALPSTGAPERAALEAEGSARIAAGELGVVILAGGMATRFGSVIKALAEVFVGEESRFIDGKRADLARWGGTVRAALMTSFSTHRGISEVIAAEGLSGVFELFPQYAAARMTPEGAPFYDDDGTVSGYATGHGDLAEAMVASGLVASWRAAGVRTILMSNVDNLGATIEPALYAQHRRSGCAISVELVAKRPGDRGGLPVQLDGRLVLAEAFRLPQGFPSEHFPLFNTNTLWIDLEALEASAAATTPWTWCVAEKKVDGRDAVQFERLVGELTWWHDTAYVQVPRDGAASRFIPVKDVEDRERYAAELRAVWSRFLR